LNFQFALIQRAAAWESQSLPLIGSQNFLRSFADPEERIFAISKKLQEPVNWAQKLGTELLLEPPPTGN
jgi:hypothetical protein